MNKKYLVLVGVILLLTVYILQLRSEIRILDSIIKNTRGESVDMYADRSAYKDAWEKANENIRELNSEIEKAQKRAGSSCDDMEKTLKGLYILDEVDEPY